MRLRNRCSLFIGLFGFALASLPLARGQVALSFTTTNNNSFLDSTDRMIGWQFSVTEPINVSALGWFDWSGDGLSQSHQVGIWDTADQSLLGSIVIPSGLSATLDGGFRYTSLGTNVQLQTGHTYRIAGYDIGVSGDPHVWDAALAGYPKTEVGGFMADSRLTLAAGNALGGEAGAFGYPTGPIGDVRSALMGPNLVIAAVPEPAEVGLILALGGGLVAFASRRRNRQASTSPRDSV